MELSIILELVAEGDTIDVKIRQRSAKELSESIVMICVLSSDNLDVLKPVERHSGRPKGEGLENYRANASVSCAHILIAHLSIGSTVAVL
jgi:hypothetical protein